MGRELSNGNVGSRMPAHSEEVLNETAKFTRSQRGSYASAIHTYIANQEPLTDRELRRICDTDFHTVKHLFVWRDHRWRHSRTDNDFERLKSNQASARAKAMKGVQRRRELGLLPGGSPETNGALVGDHC